jgi:hypothetical protein
MLHSLRIDRPRGQCIMRERPCSVEETGNVGQESDEKIGKSVEE